MSSDYFEELYGVTEERVLNFWASHLHEAIGTTRWSQIRDSTGVYLASVLGHFCLQPVDRMEALSPDYSPGDSEFRQFADLTQIASALKREGYKVDQIEGRLLKRQLTGLIKAARKAASDENLEK